LADFATLQDLVSAIVGATVQAQQEVEKAHVANLLKFLDKDQRPLTLQLRLPSIRPEAGPTDEDYYQAPILALIPHTTLRIKQVEVSFDIELGDLAPSKAPVGAIELPAAMSALAAQLRSSLNVNPAVSGTVKPPGTTAHIVLTIEGAEPSESVSRLLLDITKTQGVAGPVFKTPLP